MFSIYYMFQISIRDSSIIYSSNVFKDDATTVQFVPVMYLVTVKIYLPSYISGSRQDIDEDNDD